MLRIYKKVYEFKLPLQTASFGITQYRSGDILKSMFQICDEDLYIAKENGRNRVELI
ncbi:hypothetical protein [Candidatus Sulfurimonas baltica]|uniref:GGDEF domain-containing protein n=1 Tax=Candidatus Sulfurimonas baltica TaxID=2740404 RepID=A0A7S7LTH2_9BACT|nr:hypothetical protein [Candidatus Sulfurimonas baltica]QOY50975.1 hypothetical protein HUE88_07415 [Candidatus Sulfurimonas baltica]